MLFRSTGQTEMHLLHPIQFSFVNTSPSCFSFAIPSSSTHNRKITKIFYPLIIVLLYHIIFFFFNDFSDLDLLEFPPFCFYKSKILNCCSFNDFAFLSVILSFSSSTLHNMADSGAYLSRFFTTLSSLSFA